ncbi:hypothetical protein ACUCCN_003609, partial [Vibrio cholerae]
ELHLVQFNVQIVVQLRFASKELILCYNARLRGWQRTTLNLSTTAVTTAAHWDWKRRALTVPLEAFVMCMNSKLKLASSKHATRYFMTNRKANNSNTYEN